MFTMDRKAEINKLFQIETLHSLMEKINASNKVECEDHKRFFVDMKTSILGPLNGGFLMPKARARKSKKRVSCLKTGIRKSSRNLKNSPGNISLTKKKSAATNQLTTSKITRSSSTANKDSLLSKRVTRSSAMASKESLLSKISEAVTAGSDETDSGSKQTVTKNTQGSTSSEVSNEPLSTLRKTTRSKVLNNKQNEVSKLQAKDVPTEDISIKPKAGNTNIRITRSKRTVRKESNGPIKSTEIIHTSEAPKTASVAVHKNKRSICDLTPPHPLKYIAGGGDGIKCIDVGKETDRHNFKQNTIDQCEPRALRKTKSSNAFLTPPHQSKYNKQSMQSNITLMDAENVVPLANSTPIRAAGSIKIYSEPINIPGILKTNNAPTVDGLETKIKQINGVKTELVPAKKTKQPANKLIDVMEIDVGCTSEANKENRTPLAKSRIPVSTTPRTPNRPSLIKLQQSNSVKKHIQQLEENYRTGSAKIAKQIIPITKSVLSNINNKNPSRVTRNASRKRVPSTDEDAIGKQQALMAAKRIVNAENRIIKAKPARVINSSSDSETFVFVKKELRKDDAVKKKEEKLKATTEELKRKREEKEKNAMAAREAAEKEKLQNVLKAEKEREERYRIQKEKEEKLKEEQMIKKRQQAAQKAAEAEERRKNEEAARLARLKELEAEKNRVLNSKKDRVSVKPEAGEFKQPENEKIKEKKSLKQTSKSTAESMLTFNKQTTETPSIQYDNYPIDDIDESDSSDEENNPKKPVPSWAQKNNRIEMAKIQNGVDAESIKDWFSKPDDKYPVGNKLFPTSGRIRVRQSSALWTSRIN